MMSFGCIAPSWHLAAAGRCGHVLVAMHCRGTQVACAGTHVSMCLKLLSQHGDAQQHVVSATRPTHQPVKVWVPSDDDDISTIL